MGDQFLKGKWVLITGASRGLGKSIALELASVGANLILHYRQNKEEAQAVARQARVYGVEAVEYAADLSSLLEINSFFETIVKNHSKIDVFVANAAATAFKNLLELKPHHLEKTFNLSVNAFVLGVNHLRPVFASGAKIIAISGIDVDRYCVRHGLLAAAKSALETLVKYYAVELMPANIFVHGLNPGIVEGDSAKFYLGERYEKVANQLKQLLSTEGWMKTETVAKIIRFLCHSDSNPFTGQILKADQGFSFLVPGFSEC